IAPSISRRMLRATLGSSRVLCGVWLLFRIQRSRLNWTPRGERRNSSGNDLPLPATLQAQRIRKPFHPPFRSPQQKSTAFPRSVIRHTEIYPHQSKDCLWLRDCCSGTLAHRRIGTDGTDQLNRRFHSLRVSV